LVLALRPVITPWGGKTMKSILAAFVLAMCAYVAVAGALHQTDPSIAAYDLDSTRGYHKLATLR
jgi:hypothetical protein